MDTRSLEKIVEDNIVTRFGPLHQRTLLAALCIAAIDEVNPEPGTEISMEEFSSMCCDVVSRWLAKEHKSLLADVSDIMNDRV